MKGFAKASPECTIPQIRLDSARGESVHLWAGIPLAPAPRRNSMKGRVQIVGRLPVELNRHVRTAAKRRKVSLNAFLIDALTQAVGSRRVPASKEAR